MRSLAAVPLLVAIAVPTGAQDTVDLESLKDRFDQDATHAPRVAIVIVDGKPPLILCSGKHDGTTPASDSSLIPLGYLARDLAGDALHVARKGKLDAEGLTIGERKATLKELILGTDMLPDLASWEVKGYQPGVEEIRKCAEVAAQLDVKFLNNQGWADLLFLEPHLLQGRLPDVCTALRATLAPHVPGLDPLDGRTLGRETKRLLIRVPKDEYDIAAADSQFARLVLPVKTVAAWWQWRMSQGMPLWTGPRAGSMGRVPGQDEHKRWSRWSPTPHVAFVHAYPDRKAALVVLGGAPRAHRMVDAFEECLFGPKPMILEEMGFEFGDVTNMTKDFSALGTKPWTHTAADGVKTTIRIRKQKVIFRHGDLELAFPMAFKTKTERGWDTAAVGNGRTSNRIMLLRDEAGTKLRVVWTTHGGTYTCLARHFELAPEQGDDK